MVSSLLSQFGLLHMDELLAARSRAVGPMSLALDGGAGWGATTAAIAQHLDPTGKLLAFEPFPGNHGFFSSADPRITLVKAALADSAGTREFDVPSVVGPADPWAEKGLVGYSSLGHLSDKGTLRKRLRSALRRLRGRSANKDARKLVVDCVRIDEATGGARIDFVKLDLQGGEFNALKGMGQQLRNTDLLWIEFTGDERVVERLVGEDFLLFDTNYLCPAGSEQTLERFGLKLRQQIVLSTSVPAWLASRERESLDYLQWFREAKRARAILQTDLCAVNRRFVGGFMRTLGALARPDEVTGP